MTTDFTPSRVGARSRPLHTEMQKRNAARATGGQSCRRSMERSQRARDFPWDRAIAGMHAILEGHYEAFRAGLADGTPDVAITGVTATPWGRFRARVWHEKRRYNLGVFDTAAEAAAAVEAKRRELSFPHVAN